MIAAGDAAGLDEIQSALASLRSLAGADRSDARSQRDLMAMLVTYGDALAPRDQLRTRDAYREAQQIGTLLSERSGSDEQARSDLAAISARLSTAAAVLPELQLFSWDGDRRVLLEAGAGGVRATSRVNIVAKVPPGWHRYIILFGAEGAPSLFDEREMARKDWSVLLDGPPPSETILLLSSPTELTAAVRQQLANDISAIPGPRTVDWDSHVLWSDDAGGRLVSTASARGDIELSWVKSLEARLRRLDGVRFRGRTIPLGGAP
jgi:hypothetical protein